MQLEQLLPDSAVEEYIALGNADTNISFRIGYKMIEDWRLISKKKPEYPKMKFYREVGQLLGGRTDRMVSEYMRVAEVFTQGVMDDSLSFAIHSHCCKFDNPIEILVIAQDQLVKTGKPPSLEWLEKATESEEQIEETKLVQEVERSVLSSSAYYFATELKRLLTAVQDKLASVLGEDRAQELEAHLVAIKEILDEVEESHQ